MLSFLIKKPNKKLARKNFYNQDENKISSMSLYETKNENKQIILKENKEESFEQKLHKAKLMKEMNYLLRTRASVYSMLSKDKDDQYPFKNVWLNGEGFDGERLQRLVTKVVYFENTDKIIATEFYKFALKGEIPSEYDLEKIEQLIKYENTARAAAFLKKKDVENAKECIEEMEEGIADDSILYFNRDAKITRIDKSIIDLLDKKFGKKLTDLDIDISDDDGKGIFTGISEEIFERFNVNLDIFFSCNLYDFEVKKGSKMAQACEKSYSSFTNGLAGKVSFTGIYKDEPKKLKQSKNSCKLDNKM